MTFFTPDLCDDFADHIVVADPLFTSYGARQTFSGEIATIKCFEDNSLVRELVAEPGHGKVLVIDAGGSMRRAVLGDMLAEKAVANGWQGVVIYGCLRDVDQINGMELGVKALGTHPMKTDKRGEGQRDLALQFAGIRWQPGHYVYSDNNGIIVADKDLL
jgi:regulator of ribonuclease activity A